ncbi:DUF1254 domain-containing protein [Bradyrhizobium pachyrhizi]|uniref:DUF1254 domain-containing protein n=1 Tax=Bradyrhizobium pachyrhizi TaxID=280333 RepID=UPI0024B19A00|nr:DUF1254 domain-containing protein [Bradyrhizobium pachyrhizi]WFU53316.1 DUF1254 domain-containing protein [Bradyrhizobium pachyrhizi]
MAHGQAGRFDDLANLPFEMNRPTQKTAETLTDELLFQRATQTYLWAMPLINTLGMKVGAEEAFGTGYNVMPIWMKRLDAKTHVTTPNSDLIYGMVFEDLGKTGPLVFEAPPNLQGILLDFWQRPMPVDGGKFAGDVGLPGPDGGKGGKFLILPPGYKGEVPKGYYVYRSGTNSVFIFLRSFYKDPKDTKPAVDLMKQSRIYPLGKKASARPMSFPDASGKSLNMLPRNNIAAFEELKQLLDAEGTGLADPDWLGMLDGLGITLNRPFKPDDRMRAIVDAAAKTAYKMTRVIGLEGGVDGVDYRVYADRKWLNPVNNMKSRWPKSATDLSFLARQGGQRALDARIWFFTDYYSISPGMVSMTPGKGAFYMIAFQDSDGDALAGDRSYKVNLPKDIPAELFWSVTLYEAENASGLDNGQPFPSLGKLDKPAQNADGSTDLYIGPKAPAGKEGNWLATAPGRGFFAILRLYAPAAPAIDGSWKPGDIEKVK